MNPFEILLLALILDAIFGEPDWLWKHIPHPVQIVGKCIEWFDQNLNEDPLQKIKGFLAIGILVFCAGLLGLVISIIPYFGLIEVIIVAILLAHKSLIQHSMNVAIALTQKLSLGRLEVSKIVGRTTDHMQPSDVSRATIESAAENFSDGVIAPALWYLVLGLPGILIYKVVNTADSMIGYKTETYSEFGYAAAKLDDILNWVPARFTSLLICLTSKPRDSFNIVLRDAPLHRSPNAGWPEAAMAAVHNIALAGPRFYNREKVDYPYVNKQGRYQLGPEDIQRSVSTLNIIWAGFAIVLFILVLIF